MPKTFDRIIRGFRWATLSHQDDGRPFVVVSTCGQKNRLLEELNAVGIAPALISISTMCGNFILELKAS